MLYNLFIYEGTCVMCTPPVLVIFYSVSCFLIFISVYFLVVFLHWVQNFDILNGTGCSTMLQVISLTSIASFHSLLPATFAIFFFTVTVIKCTRTSTFSRR